MHLLCAKLSPHNFVCMWSHDVTCVKSNVVRGPGPVVRRCSPHSLSGPAPRRNHHCRDCLYNIKHIIQSKYINFGLFEGVSCSEHSSNFMDRGAFSSHPRYHLPKKRNNDSSQNPTLQTPSSPKHPGTDAGEDPHHQSRANVRLSMLIKPSFHRATKSNTTHLSRTG